MGGPHRAVGGVHALAPRPRRPHHVHLDVGGVDLDVDVLRLGHHRNGDRAGVDAPLRLGRRDPLHPVHARFVLEAGIDSVARDGDRGVLDTARRVLARVHHREAPTLPLGVAQVHAQHLGGEEPGLVASGARAHLEDHVPLVVRVLGKQQDLQLLLQLGGLGAERGQLVLRHLPHLGVGVVQRGLVVGHLRADALELAERLHQRLELGALLRRLAKAHRIREHARVAQIGFQALEFVLDFLQLVVHGPAIRLRGLRTVSAHLPECNRPRGQGGAAIFVL